MAQSNLMLTSCQNCLRLNNSLEKAVQDCKTAAKFGQELLSSNTRLKKDASLAREIENQLMQTVRDKERQLSDLKTLVSTQDSDLYNTQMEMQELQDQLSLQTKHLGKVQAEVVALGKNLVHANQNSTNLKIERDSISLKYTEAKGRIIELETQIRKHSCSVEVDEHSAASSIPASPVVDVSKSQEKEIEQLNRNLHEAHEEIAQISAQSNAYCNEIEQLKALLEEAQGSIEILNDRLLHQDLIRTSSRNSIDRA